MIHDIKIEDNKKYYYVISYYNTSDFIKSDLTNTDISIFEIDEWENMLTKSELYNKCVKILSGKTDKEYLTIQPEHRDAVYYLYYMCKYCKYNDFTSLEYYKGCNKDIYERVFIETKNNDRGDITINSFRAWIVNNLDEINKNYDIIKMYENE
jgi:hypothetical protein